MNEILNREDTIVNSNNTTQQLQHREYQQENWFEVQYIPRVRKRVRFEFDLPLLLAIVESFLLFVMFIFTIVLFGLESVVFTWYLLGI